MNVENEIILRDALSRAARIWLSKTAAAGDRKSALDVTRKIYGIESKKGGRHDCQPASR